MIVGAYHHTYGSEALIVRASNNYGPRQYPEKLIPLCILNALAGDPLPVYGDGMQVRNWLWVEDFASAIDTVLECGEAGEVYNVGGPDELPNIDVVRRILELTGRDESLIEYVDGPPRPRPPLLARLGEDRGARLGGRGRLRRGDRAHGRVVPRQRVVVGADPLRRVPRVLRAPVRRATQLAELSSHRWPTLPRHDARRARPDRARGPRRRARLPGRDLQRRRLARAGRRRRVRPGQPLPLGAAGSCAACTSRPSPGQAKLVRCVRGRDLGRRRRPAPRLADLRPVGGPRARRRRATASCSSRSASRTASACSARSPTSTTSSRATTTRRPRRGSPGTTPRSAVEWPRRRSAALRARPERRRGSPRSPTSCRSRFSRGG